MGSHELHLGVVGIASTENHSLREDSGKLPGLHIGEHQDLVSKHVFHRDEWLKTGHNRTQLSFTEVNLLDIKFLRLRMSLALYNLADSDVTLSERLQLLRKVCERIGSCFSTSSRLLLTSCCTVG